MDFDVVLDACTDELEKIAFELTRTEKRVGMATAGAALGGASTALMYAPVSAGIKMKWGTNAALAFTGLNVARGATIGALIGAAVPSISFPKL